MLRLSEWEELDMDCEKSNQVYSLLMENTPQSRQDKKSTYVNRRNFGTIQKNRMLPLVTGSPFGSPGATSSLFHNNRAQSSDHTLQMQTFMSETTENMYQFQDTLNGLTMLEPTEEITSTTAVLLAKEDPDLHVTGSLCQDFLDVYMSYPGEHEIFDLLLQYESLCSQSAEQLIRITRKAASAQQKLKKAIIALRMLQEERNSWRLIRILFQDRLEVENMEDNEILMDTLGKKVDDKQIVENLYQRNSFVRQCQLVVDWLEKNAADDFDDTYFDKLEHFSDHCVAWEHTLHDLQSFGSEFDLPTRSMIITEMDPDAPIRQQNKILNNIDKEDEARLLKYMFVSIRAGALDQAQKLTEKFGQPWLAAALEGWRLYHDPNYSDDFNMEGDVLLPIEGNLYRDIWKTVCWRMSTDANIPVYEKAMFAAFSGNLKALLPACVNWEDHLWAYVRVLVDQHIEEELYSSAHQERSMEDLPPSYCEKLDMNQIFQELEASESEIVKKEGLSSMHIIQKYIIVDDIDGLIEEMCSWLQKSSCLNINLIRFMAHLVLFIRLIGRSKKEELCILILEAYVKELIKEHRVPIVAAYTATLPAAQQIVWYAKFLEGITDNTERQQCLQYAEEAGLNIPLITKTVVENMRGKDATVKEPIDSLTTETTEDDRQKIEAIDWLVFDPTQRGEAIRQANALMRIFVASKKIDAARQVFAKIPTDSLAIVMGQWTRMTGNNELCAEDDNAAREYLCFKAYLEACDGFNDWFHHFQHEKPKCPEPLVGDHIKFKDKVAHEHQVKQYEADLERWESSLWSQTKVTSDLLYNVLLFVSGGWMVDQRVDGILSEGRQKQMSLLRKLCIPQITLLLHSVLHNTEQYKECIQLVDIISSEKNQLYKEFSVQELRNFMCMIRESSLALLNENLDPLGYSYE